MKFHIGPLALVFVALTAGSILAIPQENPAPKSFSAAAQSFQAKLDFLEHNGEANPVQRHSTQINANEVNAWFREGGYKLPQGVEKVVFHSTAETIQANSTVDFDAVKAGKKNLNPLLSMFSGVHDVEVTAAASADGGTGHVNIQTVVIDGVSVPHLALEMFVSKYLKPKYPNIGLENEFKMPDHIDTATVGNDTAVLTQR